MASSSITYDICKFKPQPSAEFICPICHCVLFNPRMCPCRHIFCQICIQTWLERSVSCPTCRSYATLSDLTLVPPLVQNVLNSLLMLCEYEDKGCDVSIMMERFADHVNVCEYRPVECPHVDCGKTMTVIDLRKHEEECTYRRVQCTKGCCLELPIYALEDHCCITALRNKVTDLDMTLLSHQVVMMWARFKLNCMYVPYRSRRRQIENFRTNLSDIDAVWPRDQCAPVQLCGTYVASATGPLARISSGLQAHGAAGEAAQGRDRRGEEGRVEALERLLAEASTNPLGSNAHEPDDANSSLEDEEDPAPGSGSDSELAAQEENAPGHYHGGRQRALDLALGLALPPAAVHMLNLARYNNSAYSSDTPDDSPGSSRRTPPPPLSPRSFDDDVNVQYDYSDGQSSQEDDGAGSPQHVDELPPDEQAFYNELENEARSRSGSPARPRNASEERHLDTNQIEPRIRADEMQVNTDQLERGRHERQIDASQSRTRSRSHERQEDDNQSRPRSRSRERQDAIQSRPRSRSHERQGDVSQSRQRSRSLERQENANRSRPRSRSYERQLNVSQSRRRSNSRERRRSRSYEGERNSTERARSRNYERPRNRNQRRSWSRHREGSRDPHGSRNRSPERSRRRSHSRSRSTRHHRSRSRSSERGRRSRQTLSRDRSAERHRRRSRNISRDRSSERARRRNRNCSRNRSFERARRRSETLTRDRIAERHRRRGRNHSRNRSSERGRRSGSRNRYSERSRGDSWNRSPERHMMWNSPRIGRPRSHVRSDSRGFSPSGSGQEHPGPNQRQSHPSDSNRPSRFLQIEIEWPRNYSESENRVPLSRNVHSRDEHDEIDDSETTSHTGSHENDENDYSESSTSRQSGSSRLSHGDDSEISRNSESSRHSQGENDDSEISPRHSQSENDDVENSRHSWSQRRSYEENDESEYSRHSGSLGQSYNENSRFSEMASANEDWCTSGAESDDINDGNSRHSEQASPLNEDWCTSGAESDGINNENSRFSDSEQASVHEDWCTSGAESDINDENSRLSEQDSPVNEDWCTSGAESDDTNGENSRHSEQTSPVNKDWCTSGSESDQMGGSAQDEWTSNSANTPESERSRENEYFREENYQVVDTDRNDLQHNDLLGDEARERYSAEGSCRSHGKSRLGVPSSRNGLQRHDLLVDADRNELQHNDLVGNEARESYSAEDSRRSNVKSRLGVPSSSNCSPWVPPRTPGYAFSLDYMKEERERQNLNKEGFPGQRAETFSSQFSGEDGNRTPVNEEEGSMHHSSDEDGDSTLVDESSSHSVSSPNVTPRVEDEHFPFDLSPIEHCSPPEPGVMLSPSERSWRGPHTPSNYGGSDEGSEAYEEGDLDHFSPKMDSNPDHLGDPEHHHHGDLEHDHHGDVEHDRLDEPEHGRHGDQEHDHLGEPDQDHLGEPEQDHLDEPDQGHLGEPEQDHLGEPDQGHLGEPEQDHLGEPEQNHLGEPDQGHLGEPDQSHLGEPDQGHLGEPKHDHLGEPQQDHLGETQQNHLGEPEHGHLGEEPTAVKSPGRREGNNPSSSVLDNSFHASDQEPIGNGSSVGENHLSFSESCANSTRNSSKGRHRLKGKARSKTKRERPDDLERDNDTGNIGDPSKKKRKA